MKLGEIGMRRLLRTSSALIILGLLAELVSVFWFHPLAFVLFVFVAAAITGVGILIFLVSLIFLTSASSDKG